MINHLFNNCWRGLHKYMQGSKKTIYRNISKAVGLMYKQMKPKLKSMQCETQHMAETILLTTNNFINRSITFSVLRWWNWGLLDEGAPQLQSLQYWSGLTRGPTFCHGRVSKTTVPWQRSNASIHDLLTISYRSPKCLLHYQSLHSLATLTFRSLTPCITCTFHHLQPSSSSLATAWISTACTYLITLNYYRNVFRPNVSYFVLIFRVFVLFNVDTGTVR
jgi:hypothetical protein